MFKARKLVLPFVKFVSFVCSYYYSSFISVDRNTPPRSRHIINYGKKCHPLWIGLVPLIARPSDRPTTPRSANGAFRGKPSTSDLPMCVIFYKEQGGGDGGRGE